MNGTGNKCALGTIQKTKKHICQPPWVYEKKVVERRQEGTVQYGQESTSNTKCKPGVSATSNQPFSKAKIAE
jgi:hypothetical protein